MDKVIIYTDGGCRGNGKENNVGGWGAVLTYKDMKKEAYGGERETTNNKMELQGAIEALKLLKTTHIPVELYVDSAYVCDNFNGSLEKWIRAGWKKADKKPVKNKEQWVEIKKLTSLQSDIKILKTKAHVGIELNEIADDLANKGMDEIALQN